MQRYSNLNPDPDAKSFKIKYMQTKIKSKSQLMQKRFQR